MKMILLAYLCTIVMGSFAWAAVPVITDYIPDKGPVGTEVIITGANFTGASEVKFNATSATITSVSATMLKVTVSIGTTSGKIAVTTPDGSAISTTDFSVTSTINTVDGAAMLWVPGGTFLMGSPKGVGNGNEHPEHQVTLTGFWLYKYEVTVAQYRAFCMVTERKLPKFPTIGFSWDGKRGWNDAALQQHPIVNVSWQDAQAYAEWTKVALPTEAQWEYAARGLKGSNYPWGGMATAKNRNDGWDATKCANYDNSLSKNISTWPVGSFPSGVSWCGVHDLAGNVREWCADWFGDYSATPSCNPSGPATGDYRVLRGGSWGIGFNDCNRGADRIVSKPGGGGYGVGFRCVSNLPAP